MTRFWTVNRSIIAWKTNRGELFPKSFQRREFCRIPRRFMSAAQRRELLRMMRGPLFPPIISPIPFIIE